MNPMPPVEVSRTTHNVDGFDLEIVTFDDGKRRVSVESFDRFIVASTGCTPEEAPRLREVVMPVLQTLGIMGDTSEAMSKDEAEAEFVRRMTDFLSEKE